MVQEYERAVIFRLGRLLKGGARGPGIFFIVPCIDTYRKIDLRTVSFDVPPQEVSAQFDILTLFFWYKPEICASLIIFIIIRHLRDFHLPLLNLEKNDFSSFIIFLIIADFWGLASIRTGDRV